MLSKSFFLRLQILQISQRSTFFVIFINFVIAFFLMTGLPLSGSREGFKITLCSYHFIQYIYFEYTQKFLECLKDYLRYAVVPVRY